MIVAGFGFRAAATTESLQDALSHTGVGAIDVIAAPTDKARAQAIQSLAAHLAVPLIEIDTNAMQAMTTLTQSTKVNSLRGTGSVAEACALAALGAGATLTGPRVVSSDRLATCAIARSTPQ